MMYIVFMTVFNHFALHRRGFDQIPVLPEPVTRAFSNIGDFFQSIFSRFGSKAAAGVNFASHHWTENSRDIGVGGSRFGSGARGEEEAMMGGEHDDHIEGQGPANPWQDPAAPGAGMDSNGVIRL